MKKAVLPDRLTVERLLAAIDGGAAARSETRRALTQWGLRAGQWASFLAPVLGLLVFWFFAFKPAVTLYVLIVGLAIVLPKVVELRRLSFDIEEIVRRHLHGNHAH